MIHEFVTQPIKGAGPIGAKHPQGNPGKLDRCPFWLPVSTFLIAALLLIEPACGMQQEESHKRDRTVAVAVTLLTGLAIVSVLCLGIGLMWGVSRAARRLLKRREPIHTDMPDIWFLNPPEKRKQDKP